MIPTRFAVLVFSLLPALPAAAQTPSPAAPPAGWPAPVAVEGLGATAFPNSGAPEAQEAFLRGVLLLHSFEFGPAARAFRAAQAADPDFALAYWGEAMTYNHPLWRQQDSTRAWAALRRLAPTPSARRALALTERERLYLDAVETLYGGAGTKHDRDRAYMDAMASLLDRYPLDDEARAFYALAILGTADGSRDFATYMRAAAAAQPVFARNPQHPGAAHYIIHSFDDPIHAPLGLPAAEAYADIAPRAAHAQHMTSHIFVALGLWQRVVEANIRARDTQDAELAEAGERPNVCGHYAAWLHYGYLQQGQEAEADTLMDACHARVLEAANAGEWAYFAAMRARHVVDTERWALARRWAVPLEAIPAGTGSEGYGEADLIYRLTDALAALKQGDTRPARTLVAGPRPTAAGAALQVDALAGLVALHDGQADAGLALLRQAAAAEEALPLEYGPPPTVKPTHELLAEALAAQGHQAEAAEVLRHAVDRTPGRNPAVRRLAEVGER